MRKNDTACEKKVQAAMNALMQFTGMKVRKAMDYMQFLKKETNNANVLCIVARQLFRAMEVTTPPKKVSVNAKI
jgi:hypothetical protein